jgi:hypothetical protein
MDSFAIIPFPKALAFRSIDRGKSKNTKIKNMNASMFVF